MINNSALTISQLGTVWYDGRYWRRGITTGTCAAAAAKAAARRLLSGEQRLDEEVCLPDGTRLSMVLAEVSKEEFTASATVIKDGGDDPDVTSGIKITARVALTEEATVEIKGGVGVGRVTKPGLPVPPGEAAINPVPREMIIGNLREILPPGRGAVVEIIVPEGEKIALKTMNPQLGIVGGISIIGTSGIVEPMSEEAFKNSLVGRLRQVRAEGYRTIIFTPGRKGERIAIQKYGLPPQQIAQISNFVGFMLEHAVEERFQQVLLIGHIGKMVKLAAGIFHTHSRVADGRLETMAAWLGAAGAKSSLTAEVLNQPTTEAALELIRAAGFEHIFNDIVCRAEECCLRRIKGQLEKAGVIMTDWLGAPLGIGPGAAKIGKELGWCLLSK